MAKDYADQLIMESRNNVHHKSNYTRQCRCWGKCFDTYKERAVGMGTNEFKARFGKKELSEVSVEYPSAEYLICKTCVSGITIGCHHSEDCPQRITEGTVTEVYYGPWKTFSVREDGMWTSIECKTCGYSNFWAAGDGDDLF